MEPLTPDERAVMPQFAPDEMVQNLVMGEPDTVIARLKVYEAQSFDQFSIWIDSGIARARKKKSLDLLIRHVLPTYA